MTAMRRVDRQELLDTGAGTAAEIQQSLLDLRRINRRYGGIRTTRILLARVAAASGRKQMSVLDIAAGSGDVVAGAARELAKTGLCIEPTFLDQSAEHLANAPGARRLVGDALALPFADNSFDVATCSLFLHHLDPEKVTVFATEALRVARIALVVNDLVRSRLHLAMIYLGQPSFSRITRHDSIASVRRAYTLGEARDMVARSGAPIARIETFTHFLFRIGLIAWKQPTSMI
ncbi:MAG: methyltransferase domain-containing protein [Acidobacteriaceae bacterium]